MEKKGSGEMFQVAAALLAVTIVLQVYLIAQGRRIERQLQHSRPCSGEDNAADKVN